MIEHRAEEYIRLAMAAAETAAQRGNAPFGAIIVDPNGAVVATAYHRVKEMLDPSAHAEITAIRTLCQERRTTSLEGFRLYVNKEPCPMCCICMIEAKLAALYYGDSDEASVPCYIPAEEIARRARGHRLRVYGGILATETIRQREQLSRQYGL